MANREIENTGSIPAKENLAARLFRWNPKPVSAPEVEPDIGDRNPLIRIAEVLRYSAQRLEHWISPNGVLREWLRLNLLVAAIIAIIGIFVVPVLAWVLGGIAKCIALLLQIITGAIATAVTVTVGFITVRFLAAKTKHARDRDNRP